MKKLIPMILAVLMLSGCAGGGGDLRYLDGAISAEVRIERGGFSCTALIELSAVADGARSLERIEFRLPASLEGIVAERCGGELSVRLRELTIAGEECEACGIADDFLAVASLFSSGGRLVSARQLPDPDAPEKRLTEIVLSDDSGERTVTLNADGGLRAIFTDGITVTVVWLERE